jgi:two-component system, OmpR family, sensor kinase
MKNSLQNKLFVGLRIAILAISLIAYGVSYWIAFNQAQKFQDNSLFQVALLVVTHPTLQNEGYVIESTPGDPNRIVVQPVAKSPSSLPTLLKLPANLVAGYQTVEIDGLNWRMYYSTLGNHIAVAQQATVRNIMARNSALLALLPLLISIPILIIVSRQILKAEMSSIRTLAKVVDTQNEARLSLLPTNEIPDEVAPFLEAINRLLERINQMNAAQRRFIADAAHELRSPLTALSLQAQNIERTGSYAIAKERFVPLKDGLERSRHLLNQLLDLMRQQANVASFHAVDLTTVALTVIEEIMPIADAKNIDLGLSEEASVQIDADKSAIQLMLRNVVDNALRYTPNGGEVTVRIDRENGDALLQVIDNGPGIPETALERVFDPFYRLPNNTQMGSGLGLAIAKSIADQFHGSVSLRNRSEGSGLIFSYRQRQSKTNLNGT